MASMGFGLKTKAPSKSRPSYCKKINNSETKADTNKLEEVKKLLDNKLTSVVCPRQWRITKNATRKV